MEIQKTQKTWKKVILISFSIFLISLVYALELPPPLPDYFYGNVIIDEQSAPIGTLIEVYVAGNLEQTYNVTQIGKYDLYATTGSINNTIEFRISDKIAGSSTRQGGKTINLNLSISTQVENPSSNTPSSSGGSGGSGGITTPQTNVADESNLSAEVNESQNQENEEQEKTRGIGITGSVIKFLSSGTGIATIIVVIILGIGVILIKFKALQKWKRKVS